jgi:hypothetical protein
MKQLLTLTALVLLSAIPVFAQAPQLNWDEVYYTGQGTNTGKRVLVGEEDDVYVLGQDGTGNAYLARYESFTGQPQWYVQWDSTSTAVDLVRGTDGTLYATWEHYNQPFNSPVDIGVGAWDSEGQPLWTFTWNDSLNRDDLVRDLHLDPDGNILLCATTEELSGNPSAFNNISVLKLDPTGELLWRRTWNGSINNDDEPNAITADAAGNIYVAGYTTNAGLNVQDLLLLKYSPEGVLQWDESINRNGGFGTHTDIGTHVLVHANGNIIVAGTTESIGANNGQDFSIYAFSPAGAIQWPYHYNNQNEDFLLDLEQAPDGDLYLLGRTTATTGNGEVLVRVNNGGSLQWASLFVTNSLDARFPRAMALSPDGNVITTGTVGDQLLRDAYARCTGPDGVEVWTYRYTATGSFNVEEGNDVAVGANRAIYVTGLYDQSGQSLIRGLTFCLCPVNEGVCLLAPELRSASPTAAMVGADLDQDGWRDLIYALPVSSAVGVYLGGPDGFTPQLPALVPASASILRSADLDQDGDDDVLAASYGGPDLHLLLNTAGTLATSSTLPIAEGVLDVQLADLDGVNGPDIVAVMNAAPNLRVYLNNGSGAFALSTPTTVANPYRVAVGDADGDGIPDLLIGRALQDSIYLLRGTGGGAFAAPDGFESGTFGPAVVGIGDFDRDGINDLVTTGNNTWAARLGTGGGAFAAPISGNINSVDRFLIAPFPQDSTLCLILGSAGATSRLGYSPCSNTYPLENLATTFGGTHFVEVADWSNDGSRDLLSYANQGEVRIWRNCDTSGVVTAVPVLAAPLTEALLLHPVPATDVLTVTRPASALGPAELRLLNARGEVLQRHSTQTAQEALSLEGLAAGVYIVQYRTATGMWTGRVVVM